jgi:soluble lytic murein transglycosylase-like protein
LENSEARGLAKAMTETNAANIDIARNTAARFGLQPELVCAVIEQESAWRADAVRYEPAFYDRYIVPLIVSWSLSDDEAKGRATSWGLMQVMGQVAREKGFQRPFQELCDPSTGIYVGCQVLKAKLDSAGGDVLVGLLRWNGGANHAYPSQVMARISRYAQPAQHIDLTDGTQ